MPITDKNKDKKYYIESVAAQQQVVVEQLKYDALGNNVSIKYADKNSVQYKWMYSNFFNKLEKQTNKQITFDGNNIDSLYICSINSDLYKDKIKPGSFQLQQYNINNDNSLKFIDWNNDSLGPVFSITAADSVTGTLSSTIYGSTTTGITVDVTLRPYPSESEKCIFHRWTTKDGSVYNTFSGSPDMNYIGKYNTWGIGSFLGRDVYGDYVDFFVYGDNKTTLTGTISAQQDFRESLTGNSVTGDYFVISNYVDGKYVFAIQVDYDLEGSPWPVIYSCSANADITGTVAGHIIFSIPNATTGTFTGSFYNNFYDIQNAKISNTVDTRYYLPKQMNVYDGDFHRLQYVWSTEDVPTGAVLLDGIELTNKIEYGTGRYSKLDFSVISSICATPFSIFGFIESENIGDDNKYANSSNSFFGEMLDFIVYDKALYKSYLDNKFVQLELLAGSLITDDTRIFFDPLDNYDSSNMSLSAISIIQQNQSEHISEVKDNLVLCFKSNDYINNNELYDRSVTHGKQYVPSTGHLGKIYQISTEGSFDKIYDTIFDVDDIDNHAIKSSDDISVTSSEKAVTTEYKFARLYKRNGAKLSDVGHQIDFESYSTIGIINYDKGIIALFDEITDKNLSIILTSVQKIYQNYIDIDIEGEFFTRSENASGWYQEGINDIRPKSPTKYINGIVLYDEVGDEIAIVKFPHPVKKTIYDDMRVKLKL